MINIFFYENLTGQINLITKPSLITNIYISWGTTNTIIESRNSYGQTLQP